MSNLPVISLFKVSNFNRLLRNFHQSSVSYVNVKWREDNNLTRNPNSFGPLTNLPDYSFKDGRPTPYGSNQKKKIDQQRETLQRIKKLSDEVDYAKERYQRLVKETEEYRRQILERKLKRKGDRALLELTIDEPVPPEDQPKQNEDRIHSKN
ncbi:hypothetical protein QAD02_011802 [Eretmocerus hayati]|uniref:Uncharacterized protein n=1 Tax=Eretmocerus hayati TaxID=131215 RepID=A0ACC2NZK2_9HYME|nr:hypothetical protein QAD02_011802 [Eretmocerus hayati]